MGKFCRYSSDLPVCELENGPLIDDESMTGWWLGTFFSMTVHSVGNGTKSSQLTNSLHHFSEGLAATTKRIIIIIIIINH
jgi:hypothetical protein